MTGGGKEVRAVGVFMGVCPRCSARAELEASKPDQEVLHFDCPKCRRALKIATVEARSGGTASVEPYSAICACGCVARLHPEDPSDEITFRCPRCNVRQRISVDLARQGGASLPIEQSGDTTRFCAQCGAAVAHSGARFCARCGNALSATPAPSAPRAPSVFIAGDPVSVMGTLMVERAVKSIFGRRRKSAEG